MNMGASANLLSPQQAPFKENGNGPKVMGIPALQNKKEATPLSLHNFVPRHTEQNTQNGGKETSNRLDARSKDYSKTNEDTCSGERPPYFTQQPAKSGPKHVPPKNSLEKLVSRGIMFAQLFLFVGMGAIFGSIIECRCWYLVLARTLGRLTRIARLPEIVGIAMPTALASAPAADSMLAAGHREGIINNAALIAGGMANSFLAYLSHSVRVMYPVIAAIGLPGALYFAFQITGSLFVIATVFLWNRIHAQRLVQQGKMTPESLPHLPLSDDEKERHMASPNKIHNVLTWKITLKTGLERATTLLFRLTCISLPLILAMEWLIRVGALNFWEEYVPKTISAFFPEQLLTIVAAQLGGLVQSSAVSAGLLSQGLITGPQILLAMLIASALSNPFRALRRNLPTALAIFPAPIALIIVLGMQSARILVTVIGAAVVIFWMHYQGV